MVYIESGVGMKVKRKWNLGREVRGGSRFFEGGGFVVGR